MRPLDYPPELSPDLEISLKWSQQEAHLVLQPARNTIEFVSIVLGIRCASSVTDCASPLRHSRNASRSCRSSCACVISLDHGGRRGTRRRALCCLCFSSAFFSSTSVRRNGLCAVDAFALGDCTMVMLCFSIRICEQIGIASSTAINAHRL